MSMIGCFAVAVALQLKPSAGSNELAEDLSRRITPEVIVARQARPAVVFIEADVVQRQQTIFGPVEQKGVSTGSGVVIYEDGWVVTNYHVVKDHTAIRVSFEAAPGEEPVRFTARLVNAVQEEDLALLKIEAPKDTVFRTVPLGTSSDLMIAEPVIAIGNPYGQSLTVSRGIISGLHRDIPSVQGLRFANLIQTDASINPGNSGGPLLDSHGRAIGVNTAIFSPSGASAGIGFAIPIDTVARIVPQLIRYGKVRRAGLGVSVLPDHFARSWGVEGVIVREVVAGSGAARAGMRSLGIDRRGTIVSADIIQSVAGKRIRSYAELSNALDKRTPGELVAVEVLRDGKTKVPMKIPLVEVQ
jgi:S1-C subfamily serine protease